MWGLFVALMLGLQEVFSDVQFIAIIPNVKSRF